MALFKKKRTLAEILEDINALSPEEKDELTAKLGETTENPDAPAEEPEATTPTEETPEAPTAEVPAAPEATPDEIPAETPAAPIEETPVPETPVAELDPVENDNTAEMIKTLTDRVTTLEGVISELQGLKEKMDEYVNKQKDAFGYKSTATDSQKDYKDMSADELKNKILNT